MKKLSKDWITEKHIDFEYKKYILLAYLQDVGENFEQNKLYPYLGDLVYHYRNLISLQENKKTMLNSFPKKADGADWESFKIIYNRIVEDDEIMQAIESIIQYSLPKFEHWLAEGRKIYDFIEDHLNIMPVGISPLNSSEGYLLLRNGEKPETVVYEYQVSFFEEADEKYRAINTQFVTSYRTTFSNTYNNIKSDLIKINKNLPNPATFAIESEFSVPQEETFLPIAKRYFMKYLSQANPE